MNTGHCPSSNADVSKYLNISGRGLKDTAQSGKVSLSGKAVRLGELQFSILKYLYEQGLKYFVPSFLKSLHKDRRRIHQALQYLVKRGILKKEVRNLVDTTIAQPKRRRYSVYVVNTDLHHILSNCVIVKKMEKNLKDKHADQGASHRSLHTISHGQEFVGRVLLDNVRGFSSSGYVGGDRGRRLLVDDLIFFDRVSYAEFCVVSPVSVGFGGVVKVYPSSFSVGGSYYSNVTVVEWAPPKGFVKKNGVVVAEREFRKVLVEAWFALTRAIIDLHGRSSLVKFLKRLLKGKWGEFKEMIADLVRDIVGGLELYELCKLICPSSAYPT